MSKSLKLAGLATVSILALNSAASAGGFALREQSAVGLGNAFAGAAAGGSGLGSMFWNPATMTNYAGINTSLSLFAIMPVSQINPTSSTSAGFQSSNGLTGSGDMAQDAVVPASYASYQVNESVWLGVSVNTPFGLTTRNPYNWAGQAGGRTSAVRSINVTPTLAYRFNDQLSVAAGVQVMQFRVRLTSASAGAGTFAANAASGELDGDDVAYGFTLGATYKPFAGTEVGIGYRSQMKPKLKGSYTTGGVSAGALSDGIAAGTYDVRSDVVLPDQITLGLRQTLTSEFTLLAGFEWAHWEKFSRFPIYTVAGVKANTLVFDYRNGWYASLGGEYKLNKAWTLRAGVGLEHAPVNDDNRTVRLPDSDRTWTSIGATYALDERMSFDVSYAHLFAKNGTITTPAAGVGTFYADTKGRVDIFAVGVNFKLGAEPKKVTTKAMITK